MWLKERLGLEISEEKSKIDNLRKNYSEFLGFRLKVRRKGKKRVVTSHISNKALENIKINTKELIKKIQHSKDDMETYKRVYRYNSFVMGTQNYYRIATNVQEDLDRIAFNVRKNFEIRLKERFSKKAHYILPKYLSRYGDSKQIRYVRRYAIAPLGYVQHKSPMYKAKIINNYTVEGREAIHKKLQKVDYRLLEYMVNIPLSNESLGVNDIRISLYVAQQGRCAITGENFHPRELFIYRKKELSPDKNE